MAWHKDVMQEMSDLEMSKWQAERPPQFIGNQKQSQRETASTQHNHTFVLLSWSLGVPESKGHQIHGWERWNIELTKWMDGSEPPHSSLLLRGRGLHWYLGWMSFSAGL